MSEPPLSGLRPGPLNSFSFLVRLGLAEAWEIQMTDTTLRCKGVPFSVSGFRLGVLHDPEENPSNQPEMQMFPALYWNKTLACPDSDPTSYNVAEDVATEIEGFDWEGQALLAIELYEHQKGINVPLDIATADRSFAYYAIGLGAEVNLRLTFDDGMELNYKIKLTSEGVLEVTPL